MAETASSVVSLEVLARMGDLELMARLAVEHGGGRLAVLDPRPGRGGARFRMEYPRADAVPSAQPREEKA